MLVGYHRYKSLFVRAINSLSALQVSSFHLYWHQLLHIAWASCDDVCRLLMDHSYNRQTPKPHIHRTCRHIVCSDSIIQYNTVTTYNTPTSTISPQMNCQTSKILNAKVIWMFSQCSCVDQTFNRRSLWKLAYLHSFWKYTGIKSSYEDI